MNKNIFFFIVIIVLFSIVSPAIAADSLVIVDGFTGTYQTTYYNQNLSTVQSYPFVLSGVDDVSVSIPGADSFGQINENDSSTYIYSENLTLAMPMWSAVDIVRNKTETSNNVTYTNGYGSFDGSTSYISIENSNYFDIHGDFEYYIDIVPKSLTTSSGYQCIANHRKSSGGSVIGIFFKDKNLYFELFNDDKTESLVYTSPEQYENGINYMISLGRENSTVYYTVEGVRTNIGTLNGSLSDSNLNITLGKSATAHIQFLEANYYDFIIYNKSVENGVFFKTNINGTAARTLPNATWVPVIDGSAELTLDENVTAIEVVDSNGGTYDVTATGTFLEDTTLISETESNGILDVSIYKEYMNNATSGYLEYTPVTSNFTHNLSMVSNDPNATAITHNQTIIVTTGQHSGGDAFYYNFTLTTDLTPVPANAYSVYGYVYDSDLLNIVDGANITLENETDTFVTTTNASGYYTFSNIYNGSYSLEITKENYSIAFELFAVDGSDYTVDDVFLETSIYVDSNEIEFMPLPIFILLVVIIIVFTLYCFYFTDKENYTHIIIALISSTLLFICGYNSYIGIGFLYPLSTEVVTYYYQSSSIAGLFILYAIYMVLCAVAWIFDIANDAIEENNL